MKTVEFFKEEAVEYQRLTEIAEEVKDLLIECFTPIINFKDHRTLYKYTDAIQDVILSIVSENYAGVIHEVDIKDSSEELEVTLDFVFDKSERTFLVCESDFKLHKEYLDEIKEGKHHENN